MTYIEYWKVSEDGTKLFIKRILGKLDLAHVEVSNATNFEVLVDDGRGLPLCLAEDDVKKLCSARDRGDGFERLCGHA